LHLERAADTAGGLRQESPRCLMTSAAGG
jgi:hypothetical protein